MDTNKLISLHRKSIDVLESIIWFRKLIRTNQGNIIQLNGYFPDLIKKYEHEIDIYQRCILRLTQRYYSLTNKIENEEN